MVVSTVLRDIARKLGYTNLRSQVTLERSVEDFALRHFESVHHTGNGSFQIVVGEVNEVFVDKVCIGHLKSRRHQCSLIVAL